MHFAKMSVPIFPVEWYGIYYTFFVLILVYQQYTYVVYSLVNFSILTVYVVSSLVNL